jgi:hypothetical protein
MRVVGGYKAQNSNLKFKLKMGIDTLVGFDPSVISTEPVSDA